MDITEAMAKLDSRVESEVLEAIYAIQREQYQPAIERLAKILEPKGDKPNPRDWRIKEAAIQALGEMQSDQALSVLLHILQVEPYPRREPMIDALLTYDQSAIFKPLLTTLQSEHSLARALAAELLGELKDPQAIKPLKKAIEDDNPNVANKAADALHGYSDQELDRWFLEPLTYENPNSRNAAGKIFKQLGSKATFALPTLLEVVTKEEDIHARHSMIEAIAEIGEPTAVPALVKLLDHEVRITAQKTIKALRMLNTPESIQSLKDFYPRAEPERRYDILVALAGEEDEEVFALFDAALDEQDRYTTSAVVNGVLDWGHKAKPIVERMLAGAVDEHSRDVLIRKIGSTQDAFWLPTLLSVLTDPENTIRRYWHKAPYGVMAAALQNMGMAAETELIKLLSSEDPAVTATCCDALGRLGSEAAVPALGRLLQEGQVSAAESLGKIGTTAAAQLLHDVVHQKNADKSVRIAARDALLVCGGDAAVQALTYPDLPPPSRELLVRDRRGILQRRNFTTSDVSALLQQRAEIFFSTLSSEAAFLPDLTREQFDNIVGPIIERFTIEFVSDRETKASALLVYAFVRRFPLELSQAFIDYLPSTHEGFLELFDLRLRRFHHALEESKAFVKPVSQKKFVEKADQVAADHLERWMRGREALDTLLISAPIDLLMSLKRWLAYFHYDYEFGYKRFFKLLSSALGKLSIELEWEYDEDQKHFEIRLDEKEWLVKSLSPSADLGEALYDQLGDITAWLAENYDVIWRDIVSGDQTGIILLIPPGYTPELANFLPDYDDPRSNIFYGPAGVSPFI